MTKTENVMTGEQSARLILENFDVPDETVLDLFELIGRAEIISVLRDIGKGSRSSREVAPEGPTSEDLEVTRLLVNLALDNAGFPPADVRPARAYVPACGSCGC